MTSRGQLAAWLLVAAIVALAGFFGGRELRPAEDAGYTFDTDAPPFEASAPAEGLSLGGFGGFGATGVLPGSTLVSGLITAFDESAIELDVAGANKTIRLDGEGRIYRIEAANVDDLSAGVEVAVRLDADGNAEAVLIDGTR